MLPGHGLYTCALPHGTPRHRTTPQLSKIQMEGRHMAIHVVLNALPTISTGSRPRMSVALLNHRAHVIHVALHPCHALYRQHRPLAPKQGEVVF